MRLNEPIHDENIRLLETAATNNNVKLFLFISQIFMLTTHEYNTKKRDIVIFFNKKTIYLDGS